MVPCGYSVKSAWNGEASLAIITTTFLKCGTAAKIPVVATGVSQASGLWLSYCSHQSLTFQRLQLMSLNAKAEEEMAAAQVHELVAQQLFVWAKVTLLHLRVGLAQKQGLSRLEHHSSRFGSNHRSHICLKLPALSRMSLSFRSCSAPEEMDDTEELVTASYQKANRKP